MCPVCSQNGTFGRWHCSSDINPVGIELIPFEILNGLRCGWKKRTHLNMNFPGERTTTFEIFWKIIVLKHVTLLHYMAHLDCWQRLLLISGQKRTKNWVYPAHHCLSGRECQEKMDVLWESEHLHSQTPRKLLSIFRKKKTWQFAQKKGGKPLRRKSAKNTTSLGGGTPHPQVTNHIMLTFIIGEFFIHVCSDHWPGILRCLKAFKNL